MIMIETEQATIGSLDEFDTVTKSNAGVEVELVSLKTGKGSGNFITLLGRDSAVFRDIKVERSRAMADRVASGNMEDLPVEEQEALACETLGRCTVGWRGPAFVGREFSTVAAQELYARFPAIREQVNVFIGTRANFVLA